MMGMWSSALYHLFSVPYTIVNANVGSIPIKKIYRSSIYNEDIPDSNTSRVWVFEDTVRFDTIRVYIPCKGLRT